MFCPKCGTQVPEDNHYCPTCGEAVTAKNSVPDETDHTAMFDQEDTKRTHVLAALCYLSFVIALLLEPNSKFLRYHINQSLLISIFGIAVGVVAIIPFLGWIASAVGTVMAVVFTVMGVIRAYKCEAKDLPIIGKYSIVNYD